MPVRLIYLLLVFNVFFNYSLSAQNHGDYVLFNSGNDAFTLVSDNYAVPILVSPSDFAGVRKVAGHLQNDLLKVTAKKPELKISDKFSGKHALIIGTLGESTLIQQLVDNGKLDATLLTGKWEKFITTTIRNPFEGVESALLIAGSDKRGTIYGIYDLSRQIGVHPWHFWADIPAQKHDAIYIKPGIHTIGEPKVKYRGIFINDEAPALSGWAYETFGGFNAQFYEHVFELILRNKGNYLWPAMWGRMFYLDDPNNADLADEYGIVMGTSHHEPLTRAHAEWNKLGTGDWNYHTNSEELTEFWRKGMERMGDTETIVSIGMRGDGDEPMTEGTAIELLEDIVDRQREIIAETTGKPAEETPQMWALYKEVQEYYEKGMRVPDDVTLLLCDDNWGNIRKLPELDAPERSGGYGIYYHFDYVGGPRNYKWINTNQIERTWEQMGLAYQHGVDRVWIVNVGDIKPMELPTQFFLDFAWNPEAIEAKDLPDYYIEWAKEIFGSDQADEIAEMMQHYTKYNARRKPELLSPETYSLHDFNEANRVVNEYSSLVEKAKNIQKSIPKNLQDAYYQLVLFPVEASANLNELYVATAKNRIYAQQGRASTNQYAEKVEALFEKDAALTKLYHEELADGKWNHMMSQTHIGYTYWQQPEKNSIPETQTLALAEKGEMGIAIPGSVEWWPKTNSKANLPVFDSFNDPTYTIDLFNRGSEPFNYKIKNKPEWVILSKSKGKVNEQSTLDISINWTKAPLGASEASFQIEGGGSKVEIFIPTHKISDLPGVGFVESNGYVSIEAKNFIKQVESDKAEWVVVPNLGKTGSGVIYQPRTISQDKISQMSPRLEYKLNILTEGEVKVHFYFSPTLNYKEGDGLRYGIGFNNEEPQIMNVHEDNSSKNWNESVANNIKVSTSLHTILKGNQTLKYYLIDNGLVLQKIVVDTGKVQQTYLGPPESFLFKE